MLHCFNAYIEVADIQTSAGTRAKYLYRRFPLVTLWLYYLAATAEDNWTAASKITYIQTRDNQGELGVITEG